MTPQLLTLTRIFSSWTAGQSAGEPFPSNKTMSPLTTTFLWKTFSHGTVKKTDSELFCLFISQLLFSSEVCFPSWTDKKNPSSLLDKQKVVGFCHDSWMELLRARREENPLLVQRFPVANAGVTEPNRTFRLRPPLLRNSKGGQPHTWRKLWKVHLYANVLWHTGATTWRQPVPPVWSSLIHRVCFGEDETSNLQNDEHWSFPIKRRSRLNPRCPPSGLRPRGLQLFVPWRVYCHHVYRAVRAADTQT